MRCPNALLMSVCVGTEALVVPATPRRVFLFDVMDTIVADPFFQGMHLDVFGFATLEGLYAAQDAQVYLDFEAGRIDEETFCARYFDEAERTRRARAGLPTSVDADSVKSYLRKNCRFVDDGDGVMRENAFGMQTLLRELAMRVQGAELHAMSNYGPWWRIFEEELQLSHLLEWSFISCETGLRKPAPEAFQHALHSLGMDADPSAVIFVDDSKANCDAAAALGIDAIHFRGCATELRSAFIARGFKELRV
mmetsp:Transcript_48625/g.112576  ORF Transcript_48625/g.112576 Transcript_48625/m.112576 type:complete len:251 (-) Transcript_48625:70-822(-)|eukprot:CAMPEP_0119360640 /NCGR_PEP_ID=MMETSP1334-20130426/8179_1 /TAXON_ID=127549 /ORGANISM="Calcidiscus leptoporus, Strain RCC1130" /LENGTH=250 /DNA_ID=CAMNT_0007375499 /DNA_START=117 /DNA_END=869 /DNA_ORIENTATION=+